MKCLINYFVSKNKFLLFVAVFALDGGAETEDAENDDGGQQ